MGKRVKPMVLVLAVIIVFGVTNQARLAKLASAGHEWWRRQSGQFCQHGYQLRMEKTWQHENGQTYFVYIFETTVAYRGIDPGSQILLEDSEHNEVERIHFATPHAVWQSTILSNLHPSRLEIVFQTREAKAKAVRYLWEFKQGQLVPSKFV